ncbi:MAG: hypothetical protein SGILL_008835, partial [Bacillariaceae sp.]
MIDNYGNYQYGGYGNYGGYATSPYGYGYGVTARKLLRPSAHFEQPRAIPSAEDNNRALMTAGRAGKQKFGPGYEELI